LYQTQAQLQFQTIKSNSTLNALKTTFFKAIETFKQPYIFSQIKNAPANTLFIYMLNLISFKNKML